MAEGPTPRVAVVGGFHKLDQVDPKLVQTRGRMHKLGAALAETGFGLAVYFSE